MEVMGKRKTRKSLNKKLIYWILVFSISTSILNTLILFYNNYQTEIITFNKKFSNIYERNIPVISNQLFKFDQEGLKISANSLLGIQEIYKIEILQDSGEPFVVIQKEINKGTLGHKEIIQYDLIGSKDDKNEIVGKINLFVSKDSLYERLYKNLFILLITELLKALVLVIAIYKICKWLITKDLKHYTRLIKNFDVTSTTEPDFPNLPRDWPNDQFDELNDLDESLRILCFSLVMENKKGHRKTEELNSLNNSLEQKVEARTNELKNAQDELVQKRKLDMLVKTSGLVAHEINNPLTMLMGNLEYLQIKFQTGEFTLEDLSKKLNIVMEKAELIALKVEKIEKLDVDTIDNLDTNSDNFEIKRR